MYFPLVRERVWVHGCTHEFVVLRADYAALIATIAPVEIPVEERRCSFQELFKNFQASVAASSVREELLSALHSSWVCIKGTTNAIRDLKQTTTLTQSAINKSLGLIAETDQVIARWKTLGCKP